MQNESNFKYFLGIDVSKHKLDIYNSQTETYTSIKNTKKDILEFVSEIEPRDDLLVVIDLTGGYEQKAVDIFYQKAFCVHRAEGRRVKAFLRAFGQKAKTDKLDAFGLALYGNKAQETLALYQPHNQELYEYYARLNDLKDIHQQEKNRLEAPKLPLWMKKQILQHLSYLDKQINFLEQQILFVINSNEETKKVFNIISNYKGVGVKTAITLICCLPELGKVNRRQIAALAGVAPYAKDSGTLSGHRFVRYGRPEVKKALFLSALVASRYNPQISLFYTRLTQKSAKSKLLAIVACMRKIIITLNALVKDNIEK